MERTDGLTGAKDKKKDERLKIKKDRPKIRKDRSKIGKDRSKIGKDRLKIKKDREQGGITWRESFTYAQHPSGIWGI